MKTTLMLLAFALALPAVSSAKVEDFNAMINDNIKAQQTLQNELRDQTDATHQAQNVEPRKTQDLMDIADTAPESVNSRTKESTVTFEKEMVHYRPSEERQMKRLANEIKAADSAY